MSKLKPSFAIVTIVNSLCLAIMIFSKSSVIKIIAGVIFVISCIVMFCILDGYESEHISFIKLISLLKISSVKSELVGKEVPIKDSGLKFDENVFNTVDNTDEHIIGVVNSLLSRARTLLVFNRIVSFIDSDEETLSELAEILTLNSVYNKITVMSDLGIIDISGIVSAVINTDIADGYSVEIIKEKDSFSHSLHTTKR